MLTPREAVNKPVIATEPTVAAANAVKRVNSENTNDKNVTRVAAVDEVFNVILAIISHRLFLRRFPTLHPFLA